jgi:hypothetical protein
MARESKGRHDGVRARAMFESRAAVARRDGCRVCGISANARILAAALKIFGNSMLFAMTGGIADILAMARNLGVSPDRRESASSAGSTGRRASARRAQKIAHGRYSASFELTMARKDMRLMLEARERTARVPSRDRQAHGRVPLRPVTARRLWARLRRNRNFGRRLTAWADSRDAWRLPACWRRLCRCGARRQVERGEIRLTVTDQTGYRWWRRNADERGARTVRARFATDADGRFALQDLPLRRLPPHSRTRGFDTGTRRSIESREPRSAHAHHPVVARGCPSDVTGHERTAARRHRARRRDTFSIGAPQIQDALPAVPGAGCSNSSDAQPGW